MATLPHPEAEVKKCNLIEDLRRHDKLLFHKEAYLLAYLLSHTAKDEPLEQGERRVLVEVELKGSASVVHWLRILWHDQLPEW